MRRLGILAILGTVALGACADGTAAPTPQQDLAVSRSPSAERPIAVEAT